MKVMLTGASGFVGSNLRAVFEARGAQIFADRVELTDACAVARAVDAAAPDVIVHTAIWNDPAGLRSDRRRAWANYVDATRNVVDAAAGAHVVLISTDWVFDGTQAPASEDEPPRPINSYGFLKAASELVVSERAARWTVARIAGVQGIHRARPASPREQDAGFGYLVAALVESLRAGRLFTVWRGGGINEFATPTLATLAGDLIWRALQSGQTGILHCCGGEHADRAALVRAAVEVFGLDRDLVRFGLPPNGSGGDEPIPYDTRLDARATAAALGVRLPDLREQLIELRGQL